MAGRGGQEDRGGGGEGPDLQAPGKKMQPRFMETQVTRWSRVYYPSRASECVFMTFQMILSCWKLCPENINSSSSALRKPDSERSSRLLRVTQGGRGLVSLVHAQVQEADTGLWMLGAGPCTGVSVRR